jgi:dipeptidase E
MKLFLSGGGSGEKSLLLDKKFVKSIDQKKPLLYIPIAIDTQKHPYDQCYKWINNSLNPLGQKNIVMWTEKDLKNKKKDDLKRFGGIYIGGGNTFKLLKELKKFRVYDIIKQLAKQGIPIYGGSAGAIITSKTIISALSADYNDVKLKDLTAMNLIKGYDLWCHYDSSMDSEIGKYQKKYKMKIIALPENSGLFVTDKNIEVIGPGSAFIFNIKKREVKPSELIRII